MARPQICFRERRTSVTTIEHAELRYSTVRQVLKLTEPPEDFARLIVLLLYHWAYGLVFLKAAAERVSETKVVGLTQFIPWSCGSWKFGPGAKGISISRFGIFRRSPKQCIFGQISSS